MLQYSLDGASMAGPLTRTVSVQTLLVFLATLAALLLVCTLLANLTWGLFAPEAVAPAPAATGGGPVLQAAYGLFGTATTTRDKIAPTGLALRLLGIVAASGDAAGYAVLMLGPGDIRAVREGEEFSPGTTLVEVEPARLVLERNGSMETLTWPLR